MGLIRILIDLPMDLSRQKAIGYSSHTDKKMHPYASPDIHRLMVGDAVRTSAFQASVKATVRAGDVVLDVGAGSGILSLFAAQAGAARVYAVERIPEAAALARLLIAANGLSGIIQVLEVDAEEVVLPEPADVLVSEWLGSYGVDENMLAPVLVARDRCLAPGGRLIPASVTAWVAPVEHEAARQAVAFQGLTYGLDLSPLAPFHPDEVVWIPGGVDRGALRAKPQPLWTTDCATMSAAQAREPFAAERTFRLTGGGVNGLVTWFEAEMPGTQPLSNAPGRPATHWGEFLFPLATTRDTRAGDSLTIGFHNVPWGVYGSHHIWAARVDGRFEAHDTRRARRGSWAPPWRVYQPRQNGVPGTEDPTWP
jgi:precorrin-6B methylase 2